MTQDWAKLAADLERLLKLRAIPFGMKLFEDRSEMEAIPRIRRPRSVHTLDQVVAQAARLGCTVGITSEDLVGTQCYPRRYRQVDRRDRGAQQERLALPLPAIRHPAGRPRRHGSQLPRPRG
jgi:hypothetical protein